MKQPRDKYGKFVKISKTTGERNLTDSNNNFSSERSNFNISKVESNSNTLMFYFSLILILVFNVCFVIQCHKYMRDFRETIMEENLKFQQEINELVDAHYDILTNHINNR